MPVDPLSFLENAKSKDASWLTYFFKPIMSLLGIVVIGYFTMWMSLNYVKQDKFAEYVEKQMLQDSQQDKVSKERFDLIQAKLETIITQQVSYTEQLKAYNQIMLGIQKQVDSLDDRVKYIERSDRVK
jgi:hypothetical protein